VTDSHADNASATADPPNAPGAPIDLVAIERDLAAVEAALPRLDDGTYWLDEVTGHELPDAVLADNPIARRA
jgi:RNA polymerase-binding transcription factor DksA